MAFLNQAEPLLSGPGGAVLNLASIMYYNNIIYDGEGEPLYWIEPDGGKIFHRLIHIYRRATPSHQQPSMDRDSSDSDSIIVSDAQAESESAPSERVEVAYLQLHGLGRSKILYKGETRPLGGLLPRKGAMRSARIMSIPTAANLGDLEWSIGSHFHPELHDASGAKMLIFRGPKKLLRRRQRNFAAALELAPSIDVSNTEVMDLIVIGWVVMMRTGEKRRKAVAAIVI